MIALPEYRSPLSGSPIPNGGLITKAEYREQEVPIYQGLRHPLIEALPPVLSRKEIIDGIAYLPEFRAEHRALPARVRLAQLELLQHIFQPLSVHLELERRISDAIRGGLLSRNPMSPEFREHILSLDPRLGLRPRNPWAKINGFGILGIGGVGKTRSIERILSLYPKVIVHSNYDGIDLPMLQLVHLEVTCPNDGSLRSLCTETLLGMDTVLGTSYLEDYGGPRVTADEMIPRIAIAAARHCLGLLVIDEIPHLNAAASGGRERMMNFFAQLSEDTGIPIVLVGGYHAEPLLRGAFHLIRRLSGQGSLIWPRLDLFDEDWGTLVNALFRYYYARTPYPDLEKLSIALYGASQGITELAVLIWKWSQERVIDRAENDPEYEEMVTPDVIASVAWDKLSFAMPYLDALRGGDTRALEKYDQIYSRELEPYLKETQRMKARQATAIIWSGPREQGDSADSVEREDSTENQARSDLEPTASQQAQVETSETIASTDSSGESDQEIPKKRRKPRTGRSRANRSPKEQKEEGKPLKGALGQAVEGGNTENVPPHDALDRADFIRSALEYLPGVER